MALLSDFISDNEDQSQPFLGLDDGYSLSQDEDQDFPSIVPARNSMQAAMQISDQHASAYSSLKDPNTGWSGASADPSGLSGIRDLTPSQRFHISTGLIDGRAPRAQVHEGLDYSDRGAVGFTPQNQWDSQFNRQMQIPQSTRGFRPDPVVSRNPGDAGYKTAGQVTTGQTGISDSPHTFSSPF